MSDTPAMPPAAPRGLDAWQRKLRPLMSGMLVVLTAAFFIGSFAQLYYLNTQMAHPPTLAREALLDPSVCTGSNDTPATMSADTCMRLQRERALILMEENLVERRYHQANTVVMFSVWSRYLGFVTGMVLAMVGSAFILGKLSEAETKVEAGGGNWKGSIASSSPGLVLCFLGAVLISVSITTLNQLHTEDQAVYLRADNRVPDDGGPIIVGTGAVAPDAPPPK